MAKAFPPAHAINQVIKTAKTYWKEHPKKYIGIHCAYGAMPMQIEHPCTSFH